MAFYPRNSRAVEHNALFGEAARKVILRKGGTEAHASFANFFANDISRRLCGSFFQARVESTRLTDSEF